MGVNRIGKLGATAVTYQGLANLADRWDGLAHDDHRALLASVLSRVVVTSEAVDVQVHPEVFVHIGRHGTDDLPEKPLKQDRQTRPLVLTVSARLTRCGTEMKLALGNEQDRPPRPDPRLITVVARAHR